MPLALLVPPVPQAMTVCPGLPACPGSQDPEGSRACPDLTDPPAPRAPPDLSDLRAPPGREDSGESQGQRGHVVLQDQQAALARRGRWERQETQDPMERQETRGIPVTRGCPVCQGLRVLLVKLAAWDPVGLLEEEARTDPGDRLDLMESQAKKDPVDLVDLVDHLERTDEEVALVRSVCLVLEEPLVRPCMRVL